MPLLAIPNISAEGVSETLASTSRNMVETALIKTNKFTVLSYTDMEEILEAQAFSLSGCTDESCAIEIGELLAVDNIVVGDLSQVGEGMVLSIRLVNVTSGHTVSGEVVTIAELGAMQDFIFQAAFALAGMKYSGGTAVTENGSLYVTAPEGKVLEVRVDGETYGTTPTLIENLSFGVHLLEAADGTYRYKSEISVVSKDVMEVKADISLLKGNLFLSVVPSSAQGYDILIDGISSKAGLLKDLPVGERTVEISGGGWYFSGTVIIETGKTNRFVADLIEAGTLQFFGPEGIFIEIESSDGTLFPIDNIKAPSFFPVGIYNFSISHPDYETVTGSVEVSTGVDSSINPEYEHNEMWIIA